MSRRSHIKPDRDEIVRAYTKTNPRVKYDRTITSRVALSKSGSLLVARKVLLHLVETGLATEDEVEPVLRALRKELK